MESPKPQDSLFAGKLLVAMAAKLSSELSTFSGWMITAFGALLGVMLANIESVTKFIPVKALGWSVSIFLSAVALHVIQRYLASIVAGSVAAGEAAEAIPPHDNVDMRYVLGQLEQSTLWPTRLLVRWSNSKIANGDLAVAGRMNARLAQIQAWLVFFQLGLVLWAAYSIARAL